MFSIKYIIININIIVGGGLSANYDNDNITPTFNDYVTAIIDIYPNFLNQNRKIVTGIFFYCNIIIFYKYHYKYYYFIEFGKALIAKSGIICTRIEDIIEPINNNNNIDCIAITHSGADLMLRTAYCPQTFSHRFYHLSTNELLNKPNDQIIDKKNNYSVTISGPLCFR